MSTPRPLTAQGGPRPGRSAQKRYGFAVLAALIGVGSALILSLAISDVRPLRGPRRRRGRSVAYGGLGPGLLTTALAWAIGLWLLVEPRGELRIEGMGATREMGCRPRRRPAPGAAHGDPAEGATPSCDGRGGRAGRDQGPVGAPGPGGCVLRSPDAGRRRARTRRAASSAAGRARRRARPRRRSRPRSRRPGHGGGADASRGHAHPADRASADRAGGVERRGGRSPQPRGVRALVPGRHQAHVLRASGVAVPLRVAGEVVGAISFLYDDEDAMLEDAEALAGIAADLGGQALERAGFYERELESRQALDRILRGCLRPSTRTARTPSRTRSVARLGWPSAPISAWSGGFRGTRSSCSAATRFSSRSSRASSRASRTSRTCWTPSETCSVLRRGCPGGGRRERTRARAPSGIALEPAPARRRRGKGRAPDHRVLGDGRHGARSSTIVLARRLADQAGLAFEQLERRRAEAEVIAYADETRRLQEVTEALSVAVSATDVGDACLAHAVSAVGADAGFVVVSRSGRSALRSSRAPATRSRSSPHGGASTWTRTCPWHARSRAVSRCGR